MNKKQRKRDRKAIQRKSSGHDTPCAIVNVQPVRSGRPHILTICLSAAGLIVAILGSFWNIIQPDLRYVPKLPSQAVTVLESKFDASGNFVHSVRMTLTFTNRSLKPGFIDKVEFVPQSIATLPEFRITSIDKTYIFWRQQKEIEVTFLMTVPTDPTNNMNTTRELPIDQVLAAYDNTGRKVDHLTNGMYGRIHFNFRDLVKVEAKQIADPQ